MPTYQDERYYRADDVLMVRESLADAQLSGRPMFERVDSSTPEKITSSGEALVQEHQHIVEGKPSASSTAPDPTGAADVLGTDKGTKTEKK
jgi:hypothetical protein